MDDMVIHRGPDDEGLYSDELCALGMRRLAIIDLAAGSQPIWNEDHTIAVVFNGEIYNFRSLRDKLKSIGHIFSTESDTEVIVHGYESYGTGVFNRLEGMFAICLYNAVEKKWIIARDRFGEKPLYYFKNEKLLVFGSELKSLTATSLFEKRIDREALSYFFQLTYIPAPLSIYEGVKKLMPGKFMTISDNGNVEINEYWRLVPQVREECLDYEYCKRQLREKVFSSVEKRMISDVPVGAFLSGGFDSTIIVGVMSQISDKPINTFTVGFPDKAYDETYLAGLAAKKNNTNHRILRLDWNEAGRDIETILENMDEPYADSSLIAAYAISKMTRQHVTVALTGDAGDELFAGYNKYLIGYYTNLYKKVPEPFRKHIIEPAAGLLPTKSAISRKVNKVIGNSDRELTEQRIRTMSLGFKYEEACKLIESGDVSKMSSLEEIYNRYPGIDEQMRTQYLDFNTVIEGDMLTKVDRAGMLASLETRAPLLDSQIVELAFSMPSNFKIDGKKRKIIWKDTFSDMIPPELFKAKKKGFSVPIGMWLEKDLRSNLQKYSEKSFLAEQGLFSYEYISNMINNHFAGKENRYSELWAFYVFQNWYVKQIFSQ